MFNKPLLVTTRRPISRANAAGTNILRDSGLFFTVLGLISLTSLLSAQTVRAIHTGSSPPSVFPTVLLIAAAILASMKNSYVEDITGSGLGFGGAVFLYWMGTALPILALVWLIWPKLLLNVRGPKKDGVAAAAVRRRYAGYFRLAALGLLAIHGVSFSLVIGAIR